MPVVAVKTYIEYRNDAYWVEGTRISLDSIAYAFQQGLSPESIVQSFPDAYLAAEEAAFDAMPQPLQSSDLVLYNKLMAAKAAK
ncbi:MAG: DUF433 domain-containing protein [Microcoleus sp. PH2017_19_SFW_U_A]|nr:DUF433 domain-containing protein [Microcoleus sp. PH2017_19_SFW_U_A]